MSSNLNEYRSAIPIGESAGSPSVRESETETKFRELKESLAEAVEDASTCIDGSVGAPRQQAVIQAYSVFFHILPFDTPLVSCLPDGGIALQWTRRPSSILTLSFDGDGYVSFAAQFAGGNRLRGTLELRNDCLPEDIERLLSRNFTSSLLPWITSSKTLSQ